MNVDVIQARSVFAEAVENHSPDQWPRFLDEACGADLALRRHVEVLLRAHLEEDSFLDRGVLDETASHAVSQAVSEKPGILIGPYKLLQQIGEGGMGVVYMAEQKEPVERRVAVKVIKPGMDSRQVIARFEAERQALARMDHPNVAKVLDAGTTESGRPYFVMELVHGLPITEYCDASQACNRERMQLFVEVCRAVQHAHQKGIIHRDLKPSNILVTSDDGRPIPKVIDFGIAKALSGKLTEKTLFTEFGQMIGTPMYMAPEQAALKLHDVDTRSDVYSLGVLLYELLTGSTPFDQHLLSQGGFDDVRRLICEVEPPLPSHRVSTLEANKVVTVCDRRKMDRRELSQSLKGELDWIVMTALAKHRNERYETVSAFASDVERYLRNETVLACPPTWMYRFRKFAGRNRAVLATVSLVIAALVVGLIGTAWQATRASRALARAQAAETRARENLDQAMRAVDRLLTRISTEKLGNLPHATRLRRELLEDAEALYEGLAELNPESPELAIDVAKANRRLAEIQLQLEDRDTAKKSASRALSLLNDSPESLRDQPLWRIEAARTHVLMGRIKQSANINEAVPEYRLAIQDLAEVETDDSLRCELLEVRAEATRVLANAYYQLGQNASAEAAFEEGNAVFQELIDRFPDKTENVFNYAKHLVNQGNLLGQQSNPQASGMVYRRAIDLLTEQGEELPAEGRNVLGVAWLNLGTSLFQQEKKDEGLLAYQESSAQLERLVKEFPMIPEYRDRLANTLMNLAAYRGMDHENASPAIECAEQALTHTRFLVENFSNSDYRHMHAGSLTNLSVLLGFRGEDLERQEQLVRDAIKEEQLAIESNPARFEYRLFLLKQFYALAGIQTQLGNVPEATDTWAKGMEIGRQLVEEHPESKEAANVLRALEKRKPPASD